MDGGGAEGFESGPELWNHDWLLSFWNVCVDLIPGVVLVSGIDGGLLSWSIHTHTPFHKKVVLLIGESFCTKK